MSEASTECNQDGEERIPRMFGGLWLLRRLARGGMGEVYLAARPGIDGAERPCVVKMIRRDHAGDRSFLARFLDEARVQAQLHHHGVAQIVEASTDPSGEPYVVVEYVEGRSLGEVRGRALQSGIRLEWPFAVAIAVSVADALGHVHERTDSHGRPLSIVHRDLSPQNIMVGYDGELKLIDFGTARGQNRRCHTISGVVFAKPGYVAPEVANGVTGDFRVDLYALGIILWELLAGRRFLQGDATEHLALVAKDERNPTPLAALAGAPLALDAIIARLVAHKVEDRYPSAKLAAFDLVKLLAAAPGLPNGERGVRARLAQLMRRLYPGEPGRSRAEFASLFKAARWEFSESEPKEARPEPSKAPASDEGTNDGRLSGTRYRPGKVLGRGATAIVYEAVHVDLLRRVALKVMSPEQARSPEASASFLREARTIARLEHPNLVTVHDFGETSDGRAYCAMELLEGETLQARLAREQRLPVREAVALAIAACHGLEAAHAQGVIHRDLKPANLFLTRTDDNLKILDFGLAQGGQPVAQREGEAPLSIAGTPEYMAPEQARSGAVDARADIYALGCVLYEMCTGRLPFVATSPLALAEKKGRALPESMRVRAPSLGLPAALDRVVMKALAPQPDGRYESAAEFRLALAGTQKAKDRRRTMARWAGYALLGAAVVFGGAELRLLNPRFHTGALVRVAGQMLEILGPPRPEQASEASVKPVDFEQLPPLPASASAVPEPPPLRAAALEGARMTPKARPKHVQPPSPDPVTAALARGAAALDNQGAEVALAIYRAVAADHPHDLRALRAWAEGAAAAREWKEAARAAEAWALFDATAEPRLYLARMLAYAGQNSAAARILDNVLEAHPECDEARALLRDYTVNRHAAPDIPAHAERTQTEEAAALR